METSAQWDGTVTGDAATYDAPYCADEIARYQRGLTCLADRTLQGPIYTEEAAYNGQLECTNPAGIQIQVDTGRANVNGWIYENDAAVTLNPASGNGFYRVVLQRDYVAQTIAAALIYNAIATPALTQVDGGVWEIPLANFEIAAGVITAAGVVDERDFVNAETKLLFLPAIYAHNVTDGLDIYYTVTVNYGQPALNLTGSKLSYAYARWRVPQDFISDLSIEGVAFGELTGPNIYCQNVYQSGPCGGAENANSQSTGFAAEALDTTRTDYSCHATLDVTAGNIGNLGDIVRLIFERDGTNVLDTLGATSLKFAGFRLQYFGYKR